MKLLLILLSLITLLNAASKESCYTVQLSSSFNSQKNKDRLNKEEFHSSCLVMEIGKALTVRCGCFEGVKKSKPLLNELKKKYKDAYISTTYKSRFGNLETNKIKKPTKVELSELEMMVFKRDELSKELKIEELATQDIRKKEFSLENQIAELNSQVAIYQMSIQSNKNKIKNTKSTQALQEIQVTKAKYKKELKEAKELQKKNSKYINMALVEKDIKDLSQKIETLDRASLNKQNSASIKEENNVLNKKIEVLLSSLELLKKDKKSVSDELVTKNTQLLTKKQKRDELTFKINEYNKPEKLQKIAVVPVANVVEPTVVHKPEVKQIKKKKSLKKKKKKTKKKKLKKCKKKYEKCKKKHHKKKKFKLILKKK